MFNIKMQHKKVKMRMAMLLLYLQHLFLANKTLLLIDT